MRLIIKEWIVDTPIHDMEQSDSWPLPREGDTVEVNGSRYKVLDVVWLIREVGTSYNVELTVQKFR